MMFNQDDFTKEEYKELDEVSKKLIIQLGSIFEKKLAEVNKMNSKATFPFGLNVYTNMLVNFLKGFDVKEEDIKDIIIHMAYHIKLFYRDYVKQEDLRIPVSDSNFH